VRHFPLLLGLLLCAGRPASAALITIEPDSFAAGAVLTHATPGVTLWTMRSVAGGGYTLTDVFASRNPVCDIDPSLCDAITGSQGFSHTPDDGTLFGDWGRTGSFGFCFNPEVADCSRFTTRQVMLLVFDQPTDHVEISGAYHLDYPNLIAFDPSTGNSQLGVTASYSTPVDIGDFNARTVSISSATPSIRYVLAGSIDDAASLDVLRFNQVPEPSMLVLTALGLIGLAVRRRRS